MIVKGVKFLLYREPVEPSASTQQDCLIFCNYSGVKVDFAEVRLQSECTQLCPEENNGSATFFNHQIDAEATIRVIGWQENGQKGFAICQNNGRINIYVVKSYEDI